jgi:cellobiose-specific phosphotransferase system component IIC
VEASSAPSDAGYDGAAVAGAVLATLLFPFVALIAALLLQGGQQDPRKKSQLRTWAWVSGGWLVFGVVVAVVLASVTL